MAEAIQNPQNPDVQDQHILVIDDHDCGVFALDAATYSIGRDSSNAIVLNDESVSRQHALLLRMPVPGEQRYRYRLIDGDSKGKPSANGTIVNGEPCKSHELVKGDSIQFGKNSFCTYMMISGEEAELSQYLESTEFHSIKSGLTDPKATIWSGPDTDANARVTSTPFEQDSSSNWSKSKKGKHRWKIALGGGVVAIALSVGLWQYFKSRPQTPPTPTESSQTLPDQ